MTLFETLVQDLRALAKAHGEARNHVGELHARRRLVEVTPDFC
jgi:hypothetical protein